MSADLISTLSYITTQVNRSGPTFLLLFGTVGNLLNICVLKENSLHEIPCSIYLRWSSATSTIFIWSGMVVRVLQGFGNNWANQNNPVCKIRLYVLNISWAMGMWCLVGANIDRFLCSSRSASYRQWSSGRVARRYIIGIFIFFALLYIEGLYCFEASVPNVPIACNGRNRVCLVLNDWLSIVFDITLPSIFLFTFGLLTIRNIQSRAVHPTRISVNPISATNAITAVNTTIANTANNNKQQARKNDRNLARMLLIQVLVVLLLDLPFGAFRAYISLTSNLTKSALRSTIENLIYALIILVCFFTHATSFYLYTLTGSLYRAAFKRLVIRWFNRIRCRH